MPFPTAHRHASARNGAAMEFVQHDPDSTSVELVGCGGIYAITAVAAGAATTWVVPLAVDEELTEDRLLEVKNWPTPNNTTNASTTTTIMLLDPFMYF
jgi:predicted protein tyrosine phosphatase